MNRVPDYPTRRRRGILLVVLFSGTALSAAQEPTSQPALAGLLNGLLRGASSALPEAATSTEQQSVGGVTVSPSGLLDVHVRDTEIGALLEILSYQARTGIVSSPDVKGAVTVNLYSVSLEEALDAVLTPLGFAWRKNRNTVFVGTPAEVAGERTPTETRVFKLHYITKAEALAAGSDLLGRPTDEEARAAGNTGRGREAEPAPVSPFGPTQAPPAPKESAAEEVLVLTSTPARLNAFAKLLEQIDTRPAQVLIEATILRATLNEGNQFGIDFTLLGGVDFQSVASTSNASADLTTGPLPANKLERTTINANTNLIGTPPAGGFSFGIIHNGLAGFIRALEEVTDVAVVANPKLVALNRQEAEVIVGRRDGYLTTTVTQTAAVQTVNFLETGTQIRVKPLISPEGAVRMQVHPKDSNGGLTASNLPFEETTEAHADILVDDGKTVLIGGLFRERTVNSRQQVPGLGNIPLAGLLFQRRDEETVREEVIILLTVHVLKNSQHENEQFAALIDDVERVRTGMRRGLLGTGRERLAQAYFQEAVTQAERGKDDLALLNVRMALHNQPRHIGAIKLKEKLQARRAWDDEGARSRTFLLDLLRSERGNPAEPPVFERPALDLDVLRAKSLIPPPPPSDSSSSATPDSQATPGDASPDTSSEQP